MSSGNFVKPPSMGEGGGPVQLDLIYEATGLPKDYLTPEFVRANIIPCVAATFSDGELVIQRPPEEDPVIREYFGTTNYNEGTFGHRLRELFEGDDVALRHQVDGLIRTSATIFAQDVVRGNVALPSHRNVAIHTQPGLTPEERIRQALFGLSTTGDITKPAIEFDHRKIELAQPPQTVIDYGPGLQGRFHIERQIDDLQAGRMPYAYLAIGKGPFVNEFLQQYWVARLGNDPAVLSQIIGKVYVGREDGIAAATNEFVAAQQQHTGSTEFADVVVASGIHTAGYDEVDAGITNAYKLLKPDGTLLIRTPKAINLETPDSVPAETMVEMALRAGFDQSKAQFFDARTGGEVGPRRVDSLSAVFRK